MRRFAQRRERDVEGLEPGQIEVSLAALTDPTSFSRSSCLRQAYDGIVKAGKTGDNRLLERSVQRYQADPSRWSTVAHEQAMLWLARLRRPLQPVDSIIHLHADFGTSQRLVLSRKAAEVVIEALCARDREHLQQIGWLEARGTRRLLIAAARGPWRDADSAGPSLNRNEREALAQLRQRNYYRQALVYYGELGASAEDLDLSVHEALIEGAAARGEVDGTLALFGRLEEHRLYKPGWRSHAALVQLYSKQKNSAGLVKEIFEAYLRNRANGLINIDGADTLRRTWLPAFPIRHNSSTEPVFLSAAPLTYKTNGDEEVWSETIRALVEPGDLKGALAIVEKLVEVLQSEQSVPAGYPQVIRAEAWGALVAGFAAKGDHDVAVAWFNKLVSGTAPAVRDVRGRLPTSALLDGMKTDDVAFVNHVYRHMLARASQIPLVSAHLSRVIDYNLARAARAEDRAERNALFDTVVEFRQAFKAAANGLGGAGVEVANDRSTGFLGRMAATMGSFGRFDEATSTFVTLAELVYDIVRGVGTGTHRGIVWSRTTRNWALALTDEASGTLGFVPLVKSDTKDKTVHGLKRLVPERPSLQQASTVVGWTNKIRRVDGLVPLADHVLCVAEAYSAVRKGKRPCAKLVRLNLSWKNWAVVLECMAYTAAFVGRGIVVNFPFAGFDAALADFLATKTPPSGKFDSSAIVDALKIAGVAEVRINEIVKSLESKVATPVQPRKAERSFMQSLLPTFPKSVRNGTDILPPLSTSSDVSTRQAAAEKGKVAKDAAGDRQELGSARSADAYEAMIAEVDVTVGDAAAALTLFEEALRVGIRATQSLFNTLLFKLVKARNAKAAIDYFVLMKESGIRPSPFTYGLIISLCCKTGDDSTAIFLFNDMCGAPGFQPMVPPYNALIQFYTRTKPNRERALYYWNRLRRDGLQPTAETYQLLLDAYGSIAPPDLEQTRRVFAELVEAEGVTVNAWHWASLIRAHGVLGKDLDRAQSIFESINYHVTSQSNPESRLPDAVVYEAILNACTANGRYDLVDQYLDRMREEGVRLAAHLAESLFEALIDEERYELVDQFLDRMCSDGNRLTADVAERLLWSCIARHRFELVDRYLERMLSDNLRMPASIVDPLLHACISSDHTEVVERYLERMRNDGVRMPTRVARSLIKVRTRSLHLLSLQTLMGWCRLADMYRARRFRAGPSNLRSS